MEYRNTCPLCRAKVPDYYKSNFYKAFIDDDMKDASNKFFTLKYEQQIYSYMLKDVPIDELFQMEFEVG